MSKVILEYVWLDGNEPQTLRSKIKVYEMDLYWESFTSEPDLPEIKNIPKWSFDGSSTKQAEGSDSDCVLNPVAVFNNPFFDREAFIVLCEVLNEDGTPHISNTRASLIEASKACEEEKFWFAYEQEYFVGNNKRGRFIPLGFHESHMDGSIQSLHGEQGPYYCGVGASRVFGRKLSDQHLDICLDMGLEMSGTNAEVAPGQWEYQVGPKGPIEISDQMWVSRYILEKLGERMEIDINYHPKPLEGDWNGSGMHVNLSTQAMRIEGGDVVIQKAIDKLSKKHKEHMNVYGKYNEKRMTGEHETASYEEFSFGGSDRGKSIRVPVLVRENGCGYFEDRRPASNGDPYQICEILIKTITSD